MRTTLNLDDDILRAVKELAELEGSTVGGVLSNLARVALASRHDAEEVRNGVPVLEPTEEVRIVTSEDVEGLLDGVEG